MMGHFLSCPGTLTRPVDRRRQWVGAAPSMRPRNGRKTIQKLARGQKLNCVGQQLPPDKPDDLCLSDMVPVASSCKPTTAKAAEDGAASKEAAPPPSWGSKRLYWVDECPSVLQYNKNVRSGYRAGLSPKQCICSIAQYHNETGNIWAHLLPILAILLALYFNVLRMWPKAPVAFLENLVPILLCLSGSVMYHSMMAHHWHYKKFLACDVCGIFLLMLSGMHPCLWWGMHEHPHARMFFIVSYYLAAAACATAGVAATNKTARAVPLLVLLLVRLGAILVRWAWDLGCQAAVMQYLAMEVLSASGAIINVLRIPEKWFCSPHPRKAGPFDYWLNSHQIMHILVVWAIWHYHRGACLDYAHHFGPISASV